MHVASKTSLAVDIRESVLGLGLVRRAEMSRKTWMVVVAVGLLVCIVGIGCGTTEVATKKPASEMESVKVDDTADVMMSVMTRMETAMDVFSKSAFLISDQLEAGHSPATVAEAATPVYQEFVSLVDGCIADINACTPTDPVWGEQVEYAKLYLGKARQAGLESIEGLRLMNIGDYDNAIACIERANVLISEGTALTIEATEKLR